MLHETLLQSLLSRPDLPTLAAELNEIVAHEQKARQEFRRDLTPSMKAEFIAGEVIMHSPAKARHIRATLNLVEMLRGFSRRKKLGEVFSEKALIALTRNDYEPDVAFFGSRKASEITDEQLEFPAPDFVVEVLSESTEARDRGVKFEDYALHGIAEYWMVDCDQCSIEQYRLVTDDKKYELVRKQSDGTVESFVVEGFAIRVESVFDDAACEAMLRDLLA